MATEHWQCTDVAHHVLEGRQVGVGASDYRTGLDLLQAGVGHLNGGLVEQWPNLHPHLSLRLLNCSVPTSTRLALRLDELNKLLSLVHMQIIDTSID